MKTKLTLSLDEHTIEAAKSYASQRGTSLSQLVERFFRGLTQNSSPDADELTPHVRSLIGRLRGADVDEQTYRDHLAEKHL